MSGGWGEKTCVFPLGHWIGLYFFSNLESNPFPTGKSRETAITGGHCQTFWFVDQTRCYWCAQVQVTCCIPHFISNLSKNAAPHDNIGKPLIMQTFGCCVITRTVDGLTKECIPLFTLNAVKTENAILIGGGFSLYTYRETCVPYQCKGEHVTFTPRLCPVLIEKKKEKVFHPMKGEICFTSDYFKVLWKCVSARFQDIWHPNLPLFRVLYRWHWTFPARKFSRVSFPDSTW